MCLIMEQILQNATVATALLTSGFGVICWFKEYI